MWNGRWGRRSLWIPILLVGALLAPLSCGGSDGPSFSEALENLRQQVSEADTEGYMLLYTELGTNEVHGRWSKDGTSWSDVDLGRSTTNLGAGGAADRLGVLRIVAVPDDDGLIRFTWGLGPEAFDQSDTGVTGEEADSAPVVVAGRDGQWVVAYLDGDEVAVRVYDHDRRMFVNREYGPIEGVPNDQVVGRPALVQLDDELVLSWWRNAELQFVTGVLADDGTPTWADSPDGSSTLDPPISVDGSCYGPIRSDPDLAHDDGRYYLAYVRRTTSCGVDDGAPNQGDVLNRDDVLVHVSTDGLDWGEPVVVRRGVPLDGHVNLAVRADGSVLMAVVGSSGIDVALHDGSWTELIGVFDPSRPPDWQQQFSLIRTGRPPASSTALGSEEACPCFTTDDLHAIEWDIWCHGASLQYLLDDSLSDDPGPIVLADAASTPPICATGSFYGSEQRAVSRSQAEACQALIEATATEQGTERACRID